MTKNNGLKPLKATHKRMQDRITRAKQPWNDLVRQLYLLIPRTLVTYADIRGWNRGEHDTDPWTFPAFLEAVVLSGPVGCQDCVREGKAAERGFGSVSDAASAFRELERAWRGNIEVIVQETEFGVTVTFRVPVTVGTPD